MLCVMFDKALDSESIVREIQFRTRDASFIPNKTLVFLDEIQKCPKAIN